MNDRIKKIRTDARLTQDAFANKLKLSKNFVWMMEKGERIPSDRTVADICREFDVSEEWLRHGTGNMYLVPEDETATLISNLIENLDSPYYSNIKHILEVYATLDPKSQDVIDDFVKRLFEAAKK